MTRDEFAAWRESPITQRFMQFLLDDAAETRLRWASGGIPGEGEMAQVAAIERVSDLTLDDIEAFYAALGPNLDGVRKARRTMETMYGDSDDEAG